MRIALPLSLAALLFATPLFDAPARAAPAPSGTAKQTQAQTRPAPARAAARQTPPRQARTATNTARPRAAPSRQAAAQPGMTRQGTTHQGTTHQGGTRPLRILYGTHAHNFARGVEASHPGLEETPADDAAPQIVTFPGTVPAERPRVLSGGPLQGTPGGLAGGYCGQMLMPAAALREVSRGFRAGHAGIDLMAPHGSPIRAAAAGSVIYAGWYYAYGNIVDIRHSDGVVTRYAHMSAFGPGISPGAGVNAGDEIGKVGATGRATGAHIHFEVRLGGRAVDPRPYLALASCDGTNPREEILEAYAEERPATTHRRAAPRARQASQAASRAASRAQPVRR